MDCTKYKNIEICMIAHASAKIKNKLTIYIDPYAGSEKDYDEKADIIFITHEHYDHCDPQKVKLIAKEDTTIIASKGECEDKLKEIESKKIFVKEGEEFEVKGVKVRVVPAYNLNKPYHPRGLGVGYIINIEGIKIYHTGDSDFIPEMRRLGRENIDIALLPISGTYVMNEEEAYELAVEIKPKLVIPIHYNYLKGLEKDPRKFKSMLEKKNIKCEVLI